jgi:DNA-binding CsgD family transcriptional regulator
VTFRFRRTFGSSLPVVSHRGHDDRATDDGFPHLGPNELRWCENFVEAMRLCSNPSAHPAFERILQLAHGEPVSWPTNEAVNWEHAAHSRSQIQHRLSSAEAQDLNQQYLSGSSLNELAAQFSVHRTTVSAHLDRSGIIRRGKGPSRAQIQRALVLYEEGQSTAAIGKLLGFSAETIRLRLIQSGIQIRRRNGWTHRTQEGS